MAGAGEFFGGLLVLLGLATRFGALNIAGTMLVAMFKVHWGSFFLPAGIEYTLALFAAAVALVIAGGGAVSLDALVLKLGAKKEASSEHVEAVAEVVRP